MLPPFQQEGIELMLPKDNGVGWPRLDCGVPSDVPAPTLMVVRPEIVAKLGGRVDDMFPEFAAAFPLCVAAMNQHWGKPKLVTVQVVQDWIASIILEGLGADNIQIKLRYVEAEVDGSEFDEYKAMLPSRLLKYLPAAPKNVFSMVPLPLATSK
jgi:hypothetical protein